MVIATSSSRPFIPGTSGWTASDLADPQIQREWSRGRYQIIEGVLSIMPPAYLPHGASLFVLLSIIRGHLKQQKTSATIATEVDLILNPKRIVVADAVLMTNEDQKRQATAARSIPKPKHGQVRILVPPTLIIESVSPDDPDHDHQTKRRWYSKFRVPNFWLLDSYEKSLECLVLEGRTYRIAASGKANDEMVAPLFEGLIISLAEIWD
jgi:Uma2 family endonuclease